MVKMNKEKDLKQLRITKGLLACGTIASMMFVLVFLIDGATRNGYNPVYHPVSALSLGERGWIQVTNFVLSGLLMTAFAVGLRRALRSGKGAVWGPLWISLFGIGLVFSGLYDMDPMQNYPPGSPSGVSSEVSRHHLVHDIWGIVVFLSLPFTILVVARKFFKSPRNLGWAVYSLLAGLATLVLFFVFGTAWENDSPVGGLIQRVTLIIGLSWVFLVSIKLRKSAAK